MTPEDWAGYLAVSSRASTRHLWVEMCWPGYVEDEPFTLPDGSDLHEVMREEDFDPAEHHMWLEVSNSGRATDMLWKSSGAAVVSEQFIRVLHEAGGAAFRTVPMEIRRKGKPGPKGYHLLYPTAREIGEELLSFSGTFAPAPRLAVRHRVARALREAKLTGLQFDDAEEFARAVAENNALMADEADHLDWELTHDSQARDTLVAHLTAADQGPVFTVDLSPFGSVSAEATYSGFDNDVWLVQGPDMTAMRVEPPICADATGVDVHCFLLLDDDERHLLINTDNDVDTLEYPITIQIPVLSES